VPHAEGIMQSSQGWKKIDAGNVTFKSVDDFSYLGDMIGVRSGAKVTSIMNQVWLEEVQGITVLSLIIMKGLFLRTKGSLFAACVRSMMLHGSEMWHCGGLGT